MRVATATKPMSDWFKRDFPDLTVINNVENFPDKLDLLILTGGEDISPEWYGAPMNGSVGVNFERDKAEMDILRKILDDGLQTRILGVCRGLQLMNAFFGGSLHQDLYSIGLGHPNLHNIVFSRKNHPLSWMEKANSLHHQAVNNLGSNYREFQPYVVAYEPETGISEAICYGERAFGVQFHPEMFGNQTGDKFFKIIKEWVRGDLSLLPSTVDLYKSKWSFLSSPPDFTPPDAGTYSVTYTTVNDETGDEVEEDE